MARKANARPEWIKPVAKSVTARLTADEIEALNAEAQRRGAYPSVTLKDLAVERLNALRRSRK